MVRAPCCEKTGLKKGPWTPEEDNILISYIHHHGHPNWRSLPKQAGLLRCGKSCRLRWTNYLRPDLKRGNFTEEEERTIIHLHQTLGNRWSVIASRLPGRTDNEIKNVWHTHLKKRLNNYTVPVPPKSIESTSHDQIQISDLTIESTSNSTHEVSSATPINNHINNINSSAATESIILDQEQLTTFPEIDESIFWSENFMAQSQLRTIFTDDYHNYDLNLEEEEMDFWYNLFIKAGEIPQR